MASESYPALTVARLSGAEPFHFSGAHAGFDVGAFWRWLASDLAGNALRGVLAEYLVARAVGAQGTCRTEWDACDIVSETGVRIEVKSAAYLQSWTQLKPSRIEFKIAATLAWDAKTNTTATAPCRSADVYVFALLAHKEKGTLDPRDLSQWQFYVVPRLVLDQTFGVQKTIALSSLKRVAPHPVPYERLSSAVSAAAESR